MISEGKNLIQFNKLKNMEISNPDINIEPKLIGREEELQRLIRIFNDVRSKNGSTVFISGEAGIGKTRLVEEFANNISQDCDIKFLKGNCLQESMQPLLPFREAFRKGNLQHLISGDPPPKVISTYLIDNTGILISKAEREISDLNGDIFAPMLETIESFVKDSLSEMGKSEDEGAGLNTIGYGKYKIVIQSGEKFSLATIIKGTKSEFLIDDMNEKLYEAENKLESWDGDVSETEKVESQVSWFTESNKYEGEYLVDDPEIKQDNLFENILLGLKRSTEEKPIVLFLDDLQWADPTTLSLLHYISRNTKETRLLILGTYRPEDILCDDKRKSHRFKITKQNMNRDGLYEEIELHRLTKKDSAKIVQSILESIDIENDFLTEIFKKTDGNPFYILEIVKFLIDEEYLIKKDDMWKLDKKLDSIDLPSRVNDLIFRRLERLLDEQRKILSCGSVEGEKFSSKIIEKVLDYNRLNLLQHLNELENKHNLIRSVEDGYNFSHSTIRDILYKNINKELRQEYHRKIAETYEYMSDKENIETIAQHFYRADDKRGIRYLLNAAKRSKGQYANKEAISFYKNALTLIDEGHKLESKTAYQGLGELYNIVGEYEKALEMYKSALNIAEDDEKAKLYVNIAENYRDMGDYKESINYADKGLDFSKENSNERCDLLNEKGWTLLRLGEHEQAKEEFRNEKELAEKIGEIGKKGDVYYGLGALYYGEGDYETAEEYYKKSIDIYEKIDNKKDISSCFNNLALIYSVKGNMDKSLKNHKKSLEIKKEIGNKRKIAISLNNMGNLYLELGKTDKALNNHKKSLKIKKDIGDKFGIATSYNNVSNIYLNKGKLEKAMEYQEKGLDLSREIGYKKGSEIALHNIGEIHLRKGDLDTALEYYQKCLDVNKEIDRKKGLAFTLRSISECYIKKGELEKAEENGQKALEISREIDSKLVEGRAKRVLGMVYREKGDYDKALEMFEDGINIFKNSDNKRKLSKVYFEYGILFKQRNKIEEAEKYLQKASKIFEDMDMEIWEDKTKKSIESLKS